MIDKIDIESLKKDLIDYYGTAMFSSSPIALMDLSKIERVSEEELIEIALNNNFDLNKYTYNSKSR